MTVKLNVALIQLQAGPDKDKNVDRACRMVQDAASSGAHFVLLPEVFSFVADASLWRDAAEDIPGPTSSRLSALARKHKIHILAGSILERRPNRRKCSNTSFLVAPTGDLLARYRKMHLFAVTQPDGVLFDEVHYTLPGTRPVVAETSMGPVGLTICYDLRFPELFRLLTLLGSRIITVPSAFTAFTGKVHWKVLLRARAIENQVFILAPNQTGRSVTGVRFHGHSLVVDPWGTVLAESSEDEEVLHVTIDTACVDEVRSRLGALGHVRSDLLKHLARARVQKP
jgi:predicted amidohydrolase